MSVLLVLSPVVRTGSIAAAAATLLLAAAPAAPQQGTLPPLENSSIGSLSQPAPTHAPPPPDGDALPNPDRVGIILVMTAADRVIGVWVTGRRGDAAVPSACMALLRDIRGQIVPDRLSKLCAGLPIRRLVRTPTAAAIQAAGAPRQASAPAPLPGTATPAKRDPGLPAAAGTTDPVKARPALADSKMVATAVPPVTPASQTPGSRAPDRQAQPQRRNRLTDDIMIVAVDDRGLYTGAWQAGAARRARISDTCIRMLRRSRGGFLSAAIGRQCGPMLYVARIDDPDPESNPLTVPPKRPTPGRASGSARRAAPPAASTRPASLPITTQPAPPPRKPTAVTGGSAGTVAPASPPETAAPDATAPTLPETPASGLPDADLAPLSVSSPANAGNPMTVGLRIDRDNNPTADLEAVATNADSPPAGAIATPPARPGGPAEQAEITSAARPDGMPQDATPDRGPQARDGGGRGPATTAGPAATPATRDTDRTPATVPDDAAADDLPPAETRVPPAAVIPIHFDVDLTLIEAPLVATAVPLAIARRAGIKDVLVATQAAPKAFDPGQAARAAIRITPPDTTPAPAAVQPGVATASTRLELFVDADGRFTGRWQRAGDVAVIVTPGCRAALAALAGQRVASGPIDPCGWVRPAADDPEPFRATIPPALP